jgi:hypothetical protein
MAEVVGSIVYDLDLDDKKFKQGVKSTSESLDKLKNSFKEAEKGSFMVLGAITALGVGLLKFGSDSVRAYNESARAEAELIQLHEKNTGATKEQTQSLIDLAKELQKKGVIEDDAIVAGEAQLATFMLSTDAIKKLTPAMADMVAKTAGFNATGEDFVNIGNLIGKVMEGNVGALGRYGVSFSDAQQKMLENGNESQRASTLADVLAQNYGGVNEALAKTSEGGMTQLNNRFGDLKESVGLAIIEGISPIIEKLGDLVTKIEDSGGIIESFNKLVGENKTKVYVLAGAIIGALVPAFVSLGVSIWSALAPLLPFIAIGALLGLAIKAIVDHFGGWDVVLTKIKEVLSPIIEKVQQFWDKLGGLQGISEKLSPIFEKISTVITALGIFIKETLLPPLQELWTMIKTELLPRLKEIWDFISPYLLPVLKVLGAIVGLVVVGAIVLLVGAIKIIIEIIKIVIKVIVWLIDTFKDMTHKINQAVLDFVGKQKKDWQTVKEKIEEVKEWFRGIPDSIKEAFTKVKDAITKPFTEAFDKIDKGVGTVKETLDKLNPFHRESPSLVDWINRGTNEIVGQYGSMFDKLDTMTAQASLGFNMINNVKPATQETNQFEIKIDNYYGDQMGLTNLTEKIMGEMNRLERTR